MKISFRIMAIVIAAVLVLGYFLTTTGGVRIIDSSSQVPHSTSTQHPIVGSWTFIGMEGNRNQSISTLLAYNTLERMVVNADGTGVRHDFPIVHRLEGGFGGSLGSSNTARETDDRGNYIADARPFEWSIPVSGWFYMGQTRYRYNIAGNNLTLYRYTLYQRRLFSNRYAFDDTVVMFRRIN